MVGRFLISGLSALGMLGVSSTISAQQPASPPPPPPAADDTTIEVQGDRALSPGEILRGQRALYESGLPYRTAPRFHDPVCVAVVGLAGGQNDVVAERIRANIREAGVVLAEGACKPNALVSANRKPKTVIDALRARDPQLFNRASDAAIRRQLDAGSPVVAWGETILRANDGLIFGERATSSQNPAFVVPVFFGALPSRHRAPLYHAKVNALVFFDLDRLEDVHVNQLADYATLHLLGDPRDPADHAGAGVPTILSLFAEGPRKAPPEMTSLDRAYLRGLYALRSNEWGWRLTASVLSSYKAPADQQESLSPTRTGAPSPS